MPRFDFACKKCVHTFEATLAFGAKTKPACPACGSKSVEKLLSAPGVVFKGTGFYKTDSRKAPAEAPKKETPPKAPPAKEKSTGGAL